jgi:hypothetical protein
VILVLDIAQDLLRRAAIRRRERLVPAREEEGLRGGNGVRSDLREFALDLQAEAVKVKVVEVIVERVFADRLLAQGNDCKDE